MATVAKRKCARNKMTTISPVFAGEAYENYFRSRAEVVTKTVGIVQCKGTKAPWLIFDLRSRRPIDGYYFEHNTAASMARWWSRQGDDLEARIWHCNLTPPHFDVEVEEL